jgi:pimeloyl-ACP methyl ester carboxylesterase
VNRLGLLILAVVGLAGCTGSRTSTTPPSISIPPSTSPSPAIGSQPGPTLGQIGIACLTPAEQASVVRFHSESGVDLGGVVLGDGPTGVVLAHETHSDLCEWMPYGRRLAERDYRVLAFDLNGLGSSPASVGSPAMPSWDLDVIAAAGELRRVGATRIVLVGANIGAIASLVAATEIDPPVAGVVAVSAQVVMSGLDGRAAAARLTVPVLYVTSTTDEYLTDMQELHDATIERDKRLEIVDAIGHGVTLLDPTDNPAADRVRGLIEAFISDHTATG